MKRSIKAAGIVYLTDQDKYLYRTDYPSRIAFNGNIIWSNGNWHRDNKKPACYYPHTLPNIEFWEKGRYLRVS